MGEAYFELERYDLALECFSISLDIKKKRLPINDICIAETLINIGDIFIRKGKSNEQYKIKARFYYEKALDIYISNKHISTVQIFHLIGLIYENMHKYHLAIEYYKKALKIFHHYSISDNSVLETCENNIARIKWLMK
jgi:tetratricopeptide (TPR) repeat protein